MEGEYLSGEDDQDREHEATLRRLRQRATAAGWNLSLLADADHGNADHGIWKDSVIGFASSRLGQDTRRRHHVGRQLSAVLVAHRHDATVLLGQGTALDRLACRACELFRVPCVRVGSPQSVSDLWLDDQGSSVDLDQALFDLTDLVYVFQVRRGGKIEALVRRRIIERGGETIRVVTSGAADCGAANDVARDLIQAGAVGFYLYDERSNPSPKNRRHWVTTIQPDRVATWMSEENWLVHTTRGQVPRLDSRASDAVIDTLLLASSGQTAAEPYQVLERIVRSATLRASCLTTDHRWPVVCFSAKPLLKLLSMRRYRPHLLRWDYEPYGVAIRLEAAQALGLRPVCYGTSRAQTELLPGDEYLFQARGKTYDWTEESEWRASGDLKLHHLSRNDVRVFTWSKEERERLSHLCGFDVYSVEEAFA